eukprot:scaffold19232_cov50-Attheya_sp.AAC.1
MLWYAAAGTDSSSSSSVAFQKKVQGRVLRVLSPKIKHVPQALLPCFYEQQSNLALRHFTLSVLRFNNLTHRWTSTLIFKSPHKIKAGTDAGQVGTTRPRNVA